MNKYLIFVFLSACGSSDQLLKNGKYNVLVEYVVDYCSCDNSLKGQIDKQIWEFEDGILYLFDRSQSFEMVEDGNRLSFDKKNNLYTFYIELYPGNKSEGFRGHWYNDMPGLMLTITNFEGTQQ